jgi:TolB-like protein
VRAWILALASVALVQSTGRATRHPAVATLHFELVDDDAGTARVAQQFADTFSSVAGGLDVAGIADAFRVPDPCPDRAPRCLAAIAMTMRADYLVFGSVQRVGHRFHVNTRVFERATGAIRTWFAIATIDPGSLASVSHGVCSALVERPR